MSLADELNQGAYLGDVVRATRMSMDNFFQTIVLIWAELMRIIGRRYE